MSTNFSIGRSVVPNGPDPVLATDNSAATMNLEGRTSSNLDENSKPIETNGGTVSIEEKELIKRIEQALNGAETALDFSIHKPNGEIVVKVLEKETGRVIREIPNEKILDMIDNICKKTGIVIDERK